MVSDRPNRRAGWGLAGEMSAPSLGRLCAALADPAWEVYEKDDYDELRLNSDVIRMDVYGERPDRRYGGYRYLVSAYFFTPDFDEVRRLLGAMAARLVEHGMEYDFELTGPDGVERAACHPPHHLGRRPPLELL